MVEVATVELLIADYSSLASSLPSPSGLAFGEPGDEARLQRKDMCLEGQ